MQGRNKVIWYLSCSEMYNREAFPRCGVSKSYAYFVLLLVLEKSSVLKQNELEYEVRVRVGVRLN